MEDFSDISIIYNPKSTGPGKALAEKLKKEFEVSLPKVPIKIHATKHAGHAEELAYKLANHSQRPLIISASGDGGYNEVVNGLLRAQAEDAHPTAGLLPAGNANDHFNDLSDGKLAQNIANNKINNIDVLKLTTTINGKAFNRYAHSYIGLGLTPHIGSELNKVDLNWWKEKILVLKGLFSSPPVRISVDNKHRSYDSLVFSNVSKMSKFLVLSHDSTLTDGKFEVTEVHRISKWRLLLSLIKSVTGSAEEPEQTDSYSFFTINTTSLQLDGEIFIIDTRSQTTVSIEPRKLCCIV